MRIRFLKLGFIVALSMVFLHANSLKAEAPMPENPQSGSVGIQATITTPPPTVGATITIPRSGQAFNKIPITVAGVCPDDLLVKIFKNNVFSGSVQCQNGSFSLQIDLFQGTNELVARVYDNLDQAGPDSNIVTVTFNDNQPGAGPRVNLSSIYAKRGADPGQELIWPIILSGGRGPYAISVDWGDGKTADLFTVEFPGNFDIKHVYDKAGTYNILIRATDADGVSAFLQLVGVANGPAAQSQTGQGGEQAKPVVRILWEPAALAIPLLITTFWLGKRYELHILKKRIEKGDNPFV